MNTESVAYSAVPVQEELDLADTYGRPSNISTARQRQPRHSSVPLRCLRTLVIVATAGLSVFLLSTAIRNARHHHGFRHRSNEQHFHGHGKHHGKDHHETPHRTEDVHRTDVHPHQLEIHRNHKYRHEHGRNHHHYHDSHSRQDETTRYIPSYDQDESWTAPSLQHDFRPLEVFETDTDESGLNEQASVVSADERP